MIARRLVGRQVTTLGTIPAPFRASTLGPPIITEGLVGHWDAGNPYSYPGTGTTWTDLSGQGNNGTLTNGPTYSFDRGGCIVFDETNDYVPIGKTGFPTGASAGTIMGWGKLTDLTGVKWIISYGTGSLSASRFIGVVDSTFYFGGFNNDITASGAQSGVWFHMAGVYTGTNAIMYVNGAIVSGPTAKTWNTGTTNAQIGRQTLAGDYWGGEIAMASVYNRDLSASEIWQCFESGRGRFGI